MKEKNCLWQTCSIDVGIALWHGDYGDIFLDISHIVKDPTSKAKWVEYFASPHICLNYTSHGSL